MRLRQIAALGAVAAVVAITACWWALALWPLPDAVPAWLVRTRAVCFGSTPSGLPDAAGWIAVLGQPALMLGMLLAGWGGAVRDGLRALAHSYSGRVGLGVTTGVLLVALAALAMRIADAATRGSARPAVAAEYPRLDRPAPPLDLVDQHGAEFSLKRLRGRVVLVTFAYGHCETVCPLVVADVLEARRLLGDLQPAPAAVIVTLDPWRDTPLRLPALAIRWGLERDAYVLGGSVAAVDTALARWGVLGARDEHTGEIAHAPVVYVVDRNGRLGFTANGDARVIAALARRL